MCDSSFHCSNKASCSIIEGDNDGGDGENDNDDGVIIMMTTKGIIK